MNLTTLLDSLKIHNSMYEGIRTPLIHAVFVLESFIFVCLIGNQ